MRFNTGGEHDNFHVPEVPLNTVGEENMVVLVVLGVLIVFALILCLGAGAGDGL